MTTVAKTIGIDARFYGPVGKGLGRYTQEIVDRVISLDKTNKYVVFLSSSNFHSFQCDGSRVKKVLVDALWYSLSEQWRLPYLIKREVIDLMHFPHFNVPLICPSKFIVTIHDLILTKYPTTRATTLNKYVYWLKHLAYKLVINHAVQSSESVITVSEFTKTDLVNNFKINPDKIAVTYEGVAQLSCTATVTPAYSDLLLKYHITKPYLLYVGNAYPHKNIDGLIKVFKDLVKRRQLQLVLVGKLDYFYQQMQVLAIEMGLVTKTNPQVVFAGYVSDGELAQLYQHALAYVFPSLYEGFGLPPLEAMSLSCPVISSNQGSLPEILATGAIYFNPTSHQEMLQVIDQVVADESLRQDLIVKGLARISDFDWQRCAEQTLVQYQQSL